jgi:CBS-domain-containing membrane protein
MPTATVRHLSLAADTAADLMCSPVDTLSHRTTFHEALAFFIDRNVNIAPVVGDRNEPLGVLSLIDLLIHVRESIDAERIAPALCRDLMTPTIFTVAPDTPAGDVIDDMLRSQVHHLFIAEPDSTIMGVVSTCDVLRHLR